MTFELGITFADQSKDFYGENLAGEAADEQNSPGVRKAPEKAVSTRRKLLIAVFATSVYKQPRASRQ